MRNTFTFFSLLILISGNVSPCYSNTEEDTLFRKSLSFGVELSYPARMFFEPEIKQYEASLDFEFIENVFAVLEAGALQADVMRDDFNYYSDGAYLRIGADFNVLGSGALKDNDKVFVGIRYGYCKQQHSADNIFVTDNYWGSTTASVEASDFNAHWGEFVAGVRTELFANLSIGWSVRFRLLFSGVGESLVEPYRIGGFGRGESTTGFDFNYSIFYRIPF